MRARETQKWLLYALLGPLALAAFGWGILLQIVLYNQRESVRKEISFLSGHIGAPLHTPAPASPAADPLDAWAPDPTAGVRFFLGTALPCVLLLLWPLGVLVWLAVLPCAPAGSATLSVRAELRTLLALALAGAAVLVWAVVGGIAAKLAAARRRNEDAHVTPAELLAWVLAGAVVAALAANWAWLRAYARAHFARREWGSSLATLDSFDTTEEPGTEWSDKDSVYQRTRTDADAPALPALDERVTPFVLARTHAPSGSGKAYDAPPDTPYLPCAGAGEHAYAGPSTAACGDSPASHPSPQSKWRTAAEPPAETPTAARAFCTHCGFRDEKEQLRRRLPKWEQGDGYAREMRRIVDGDFGLHRTRSL